ncbi:MAG TPA: hypothetical protein PK109_03340 [Candidatus Paceibacterota bacterium]|nr:hypothetical protein [Candidatus Paceibacterota bacterium]
MNTNAIIGLIVAIVVVGGGAWFFSQHKAGTDLSGTGTTENTVGESGTLSLKELMMMGGSRKCEVTVTTAEAPATGTVYVSGTDVRSDIVTKPAAMNGATISAHMIKSGDYMYSWSDMIPQGVKVKITAAESAGAQAGYDANSQVQYSCSPWIPDASKFEVPSTVTFMEFSGGAGMPTGYPKP